MQTILSIDATLSPAEALVVEIEGETLRIVERHTLTLDFSDIRPFKAPPKSESPSSEGESRDGAPHSEAAGAPASGDDWVLEPFPASHTDGAVGALAELKSKIKAEWTNSILFIPPQNYISFNLNLPFSDNKNLNRILPGEVQDVVPFDLDEFHLEHRMIAPHGEKNFDVHIGLIPKAYLRKVIDSCKASDLEPMIISTPVSALEALVHLRGGAIEKEAIVLLSRGTEHHLAAFVHGRLCGDRSFREEDFVLDSKEDLLAQLKMTIAGLEERYAVRFPTVYLAGDSLDATAVAAGLHREVKPLAAADLLQFGSPKDEVAALGSVFAQDFPAPQILTNFRTREFSYSPRLKELAKGFRNLLPYLLGVLILGILCLSGRYAIRQWKVHSLRESMVSEVKKIIPGMSITLDKELSTQVQSEIDSLDALMKDLVAPSSSSLLDLFLAISEALPKEAGLDIRKINIKPSKISLEGSAPDYASVEKIEKAIKSKKGICWKVDSPESRSSGARENTRDFTINIRLCE